MHFKLFYDYLSIEKLKQEDIQVHLYSLGTTLIYAFYVLFCSILVGRIILSMYNLIQPVTTLSGTLQT